MTMNALQGYTENGKIIPIGNPIIPDGLRVIVTILDDITNKRVNSRAYLSYAGALSDESYGEIMDILKDAGQIDANEW